MERKRNRYLIKLIASALAIILLTPVQAYAAVPETVSPMASDYLASYTAYIYPAGSGELQVWFRVTGTGTQDYLGALSVQLYESTDNENWSWVDTYRHNEYSNMLAQDTFAYMKRQNREYSGKRKDEWKCCDCGKQISRGATRCCSCESTRRAKERRSDLPTREELKTLIRTTAFTTVGAMYGVTDNAVRKWCDKYNLPRKVKDIKSYSNEEWELI